MEKRNTRTKTIAKLLITFSIFFAIIAWILVFSVNTADLYAYDCEGYWPDENVCLELGTTRPRWFHQTRANARCPQWRIREKNNGWKDREQFIARLTEIEKVTQEWQNLVENISTSNDDCVTENPGITLVRERGLAPSRIQDGFLAGNTEFRIENTACWTGGLLPFYIERYNVEPSDSFQEFVLKTFDFERLRTEFEKCLLCA